MGKCILVCAGNRDESIISKCDGDYLIAVDGGYNYICEASPKPDCIVGDFDSVSRERSEELYALESKGIQVIRLNVMKDDTDTMSAIRHGLTKGFREFEIYHALGGRVDHEIANLQALAFLKDHGASGTIVSKNGCITLIEDESIHMKKGVSGYVSVFAFGEKATGVTIRGLKYELENADLCNSFPLGVSNELTDHDACVTVKNGRLLIVYPYGTCAYN